MDAFYEETLDRTRPFDGQYPRPWMTDLTNPLEADCLIVGYNQRNGYDIQAVSKTIGDHRAYVDSLFNRNGRSCRGLYDRLVGKPSPTRANIDRLSLKLKRAGAKVLETNVVCHSSPMSRDLAKDQRKHGTGIFIWLCNRIGPKVIIVHGSGARKVLAKIDVGKAEVVKMPSLAPPAYNTWHKNSEQLMNDVVARAVAVLKRG